MLTSKFTAFGYEWEFSENTELAEAGRAELLRAANRFAFNSRDKKGKPLWSKPSEKVAVYRAMVPYYADILSAITKVTDLETNKENTDLVFDMIDDPGKFFDFINEKKKAGEFDLIRELHMAAVNVNKAWYPEEEESEPETDEEKEAVATLEQTGEFLANQADENSDEDVDLPDSDDVAIAAEIISKKQENRAKKKA